MSYTDSITMVYMVLFFLVGLVFGSFLNVVAYRVPRGESVAFPASHCPHCNTPLRAWELLPIVSWMVLFGRCRTCHRSISVRYPTMELLTGALFAATILAFPTWGTRVALSVFWLLLVAVIGTDLTAMKVPNVLSLPGFVVCLGASIAGGVQSWQGALIGAVTGFGLLLVIHFLSGGRMGLGDAKLYLSIGAVLGPLYGVESFVVASFFGAGLGLVLRVFGVIRRREYIPFVPFIAMGVMVTVFFGPALSNWYLHAVVGLAQS